MKSREAVQHMHRYIAQTHAHSQVRYSPFIAYPTLAKPVFSEPTDGASSVRNAANTDAVDVRARLDAPIMCGAAEKCRFQSSNIGQVELILHPSSRWLQPVRKCTPSEFFYKISIILPYVDPARCSYRICATSLLAP